MKFMRLPAHLAVGFQDHPFAPLESKGLRHVPLFGPHSFWSAPMLHPFSDDRPLSQFDLIQIFSQTANRSKNNPNLVQTLPTSKFHRIYKSLSTVLFCLFVIKYFSFWFSTSFAPWSKSNFSLLISPTEITTGSYFDFNVSWSWTEEVKILFGDELLLLTVVWIRTMVHGGPKGHFQI